MVVKDVPITKIKVIENVRLKQHGIASLMESIRQNGLKEPVGVNTNGSGNFVLMYGWRRLTACRKLGWSVIPAVIEKENETVDFLINNAIENLQREGITPPQLGRICQKLEKSGLTQSEIASRLAISVIKVKEAIGTFEKVPKKYLDKLTFMESGKSMKKGRIPNTTAYFIMNMVKQGITKDEVDALLGLAIKHELTVKDLKLIKEIMTRKKVSATKAVKMLDDYENLDFRGFMHRAEFEKLSKKYDISKKELIERILLGKADPLKEVIYW